jgi:hypothetical protein
LLSGSGCFLGRSGAKVSQREIGWKHESRWHQSPMEGNNWRVGAVIHCTNPQEIAFPMPAFAAPASAVATITIVHTVPKAHVPKVNIIEPLAA